MQHAYLCFILRRWAIIVLFVFFAAAHRYAELQGMGRPILVLFFFFTACAPHVVAVSRLVLCGVVYWSWQLAKCLVPSCLQGSTDMCWAIHGCSGVCTFYNFNKLFALVQQQVVNRMI